jgi:tetratricopeptide (TPR) repeat protein
MEKAKRSGIAGALRDDLGPSFGAASPAAPSPRAERSRDRPAVSTPRPARRTRPAPRRRPPERVAATEEDIDDLLTGDRATPKKPEEDPYTGKMAQVMNLLPKQPAQALAAARAWRSESPGDVMALIALGECLEKTGELRGAARAYGSIIDLFPARADLRRFAGERLERLPVAEAAALAIDTFHQAVLQRPDHPSSHRLYAFALLRAEKYADAFAAIEAGLAQDYPGGRFAGARQILSEDLGLIAAAWIKAEADKKKEILKRLESAGGTVENAPSLRFVLNWETDANDVDFHIYDGRGNHAFYSAPRLRTGGHLYADVTTGYGPECFTIRGKAKAYPYTLQAHYYSRGPMGYGMGKLEIIQHDGKGGLTFDQRPFVIMKDGAFIDMGRVTK